jgi:hypothetical protein
MRGNGDGMPSVSIHDLVIHPRENELVVGTHGRSIYIADVKPLQALNSEVLAKNIHIYDLPTINYNASWGRMFDKYAEPEDRKYNILYYAKAAGKAIIKIQTDSGTPPEGLVLKTINDDAEIGFNNVNFDQAIDIATKADYEKYLNNTKKKEEKETKLEPADDKKIYFRTGKYKVVVELNGEKTEKDLEIKASERRSRRAMSPKPTASPEEFEEWYEEMGFEETKK